MLCWSKTDWNILSNLVLTWLLSFRNLRWIFGMPHLATICIPIICTYCADVYVLAPRKRWILTSFHTEKFVALPYQCCLGIFVSSLTIFHAVHVGKYKQGFLLSQILYSFHYLLKINFKFWIVANTNMFPYGSI